MGILQTIGGVLQVAVGVTLCGTVAGAVLGIPIILHAVADIAQGFGTTVNAIAGKQVLPETNFMQEIYKAVGGKMKLR